MAVKLRLTRMGRKKKPFYRIVAVDSRAPRDGRFLENLGYYNPLPDPFEVKINEERALYWLGVGAIPTDTVRSLLRREGILFKWDLMKRGLSGEEMEKEMKRWEVIQLERRRKWEKKREGKAEKERAEAVESEPEKEKVAAEEQDQEPAPPESEQIQSEPEQPVSE